MINSNGSLSVVINEEIKKLFAFQSGFQRSLTSPAAVPSVWSTAGPVCGVGVPPVSRVQSM